MNKETVECYVPEQNESKKQKMKKESWIKSKINLLKNDKDLLEIMFWHIVLIGLHCWEYYKNGTQYFWYLRAGGCGIIALFIFLFGRKGLSYGLIIFSCSLLYVNNFYNYATIFFMLTAIGANPKLGKSAMWIYFINVIISFSLKNISIAGFVIHLVYIRVFNKKINYVFSVNKPEKLNLTDSEKQILDELVKGKLQKEIDLFSQPTITSKLKSARERNLCETTADLLAKYARELN